MSRPVKLSPPWNGSLPDGRVTSSQSRYIREWRAFAAPLGKALGMRVFGFDPGVSYRTDDWQVTLQLPAWAIAKINARLPRPSPRRKERRR